MLKIIANKGIPENEIETVVMNAVKGGEVVGTNGSAPVYVHNGVTQYISVG